MANKKESRSAQIRKLLGDGWLPKEIATKLKVAPAYVHTIKWQWNKRLAKQGKSKKQLTALTPATNGSGQAEKFVQDLTVQALVKAVELLNAQIAKVKGEASHE